MSKISCLNQKNFEKFVSAVSVLLGNYGLADSPIYSDLMAVLNDEFLKDLSTDIHSQRQKIRKRLGGIVNRLLIDYVEKFYPREVENFVFNKHQAYEKEGVRIFKLEYNGKNKDFPIKEIHYRVKNTLFESLVRNILRGEDVLDFAGVTVFTKDKSSLDNVIENFLINHESVNPFNYVNFYKTKDGYEGIGMHQKITLFSKEYNFNAVRMHNKDVSLESLISGSNIIGANEIQLAGGLEGYNYYREGSYGVILKEGNFIINLESAFFNDNNLNGFAQNLLKIVKERDAKNLKNVREKIGKILAGKKGLVEDDRIKLNDIVRVPNFFSPKNLLKPDLDRNLNIYEYTNAVTAQKHIGYAKDKYGGKFKEGVKKSSFDDLIFKKGDLDSVVIRQGNIVYEVYGHNLSVKDVRNKIKRIKFFESLKRYDFKIKNDLEFRYVINSLTFSTQFEKLGLLEKINYDDFEIEDRYKNPKRKLIMKNGKPVEYFYKDKQVLANLSNTKSENPFIVEFQFKDIKTHRENEDPNNPLSHAKYKKDQEEKLIKEFPLLRELKKAMMEGKLTEALYSYLKVGSSLHQLLELKDLKTQIGEKEILESSNYLASVAEELYVCLREDKKIKHYDLDEFMKNISPLYSPSFVAPLFSKGDAIDLVSSLIIADYLKDKGIISADPKEILNNYLKNRFEKISSNLTERKTLKESFLSFSEQIDELEKIVRLLHDNSNKYLKDNEELKDLYLSNIPERIFGQMSLSILSKSPNEYYDLIMHSPYLKESLAKVEKINNILGISLPYSEKDLLDILHDKYVSFLNKFDNSSRSENIVIKHIIIEDLNYLRVNLGLKEFSGPNLTELKIRKPNKILEKIKKDINRYGLPKYYLPRAESIVYKLSK